MELFKTHLIGKLNINIKLLGMDDFIEFDNFKDICDLENFNLIHYYKIKDYRVKNLPITPLPFFPKDLKILYTKLSTLEYYPLNLPLNIRNITLTNCRISGILPDLSNYRSIETIDLSDNFITELKEALPPNLITLNISQNQISKVDYRIIHKNIVEIDLSSNKLIEAPPKHLQHRIRYHNNPIRSFKNIVVLEENEGWNNNLYINEIMRTQRSELDNALLNWLERANNANVVDNIPHINGEDNNNFVPQNVLNSAQNIHLSSIQRSTAKSIQVIMNLCNGLKEDDFQRDYLVHIKCSIFKKNEKRNELYKELCELIKKYDINKNDLKILTERINIQTDLFNITNDYYIQYNEYFNHTYNFITNLWNKYIYQSKEYKNDLESLNQLKTNYIKEKSISEDLYNQKDKINHFLNNFETNYMELIDKINDLDIKYNKEVPLGSIYNDQNIDLDERLILLFNENCKNNDIHSIHGITYKELIRDIWYIIHYFKNEQIEKRDIEICKELYVRLYEEITESLNLCFTGQITRIINALVGYGIHEDIFIGISDKERTINQINIIVKKIMDKKIQKEEGKKIVEDLCKSAELSNDETWAWLESIDDLD